MKIKLRCIHIAISAIALTFLAGQSQADIIELFGDTVIDTSNLSDGGGPKGDANSAVSVVGAAGSEKLRFQDESTTDKPEAFHEFGNVLDGFRLDFTHAFDNSSITDTANIISDPEIRLRLGNSGVSPTSDSRTGFGMHFRHRSSDGTNEVRRGQWNGTDKISTSSINSSIPDLADGVEVDYVIFANNAFEEAEYTFSGDRTLAANTYDLFVDGVFVNNYLLGEDTALFDRDLGFGRIGFLGSSDGDSGHISLFDDITLYTGADTGLTFAGVPEPGSMSLLLGGFLSLGFIRRRK
jgi:hypothetical protein